MRRNTASLVILAAFGAVACGEDAIDPVTGGEGGGAEGFSVVVTDDPGINDATLAGVVRGTLRVALRNDAGALVDLGPAEGVEVPLHAGADTILLEGIARPPADSYSAVQLRFEGVDVEVFAGSVVGDSTLPQNVVLDVGSAGVATVDMLVPVFDIASAFATEIVVDLNSEAWITDTNLNDVAVPQSDLATSVSVDVR